MVCTLTLNNIKDAPLGRTRALVAAIIESFASLATGPHAPPPPPITRTGTFGSGPRPPVVKTTPLQLGRDDRLRGAAFAALGGAAAGLVDADAATPTPAVPEITATTPSFTAVASFEQLDSQSAPALNDDAATSNAAAASQDAATDAPGSGPPSDHTPMRSHAAAAYQSRLSADIEPFLDADFAAGFKTPACSESVTRRQRLAGTLLAAVRRDSQRRGALRILFAVVAAGGIGRAGLAQPGWGVVRALILPAADCPALPSNPTAPQTRGRFVLWLWPCDNVIRLPLLLLLLLREC
jgi:hypothetical protein